MGRSKCRMRAEAGATIHSMVFVMRGKEQPLLGLMDAQKLGVIQMNVTGAEQKEDRVARLEKFEKQPAQDKDCVRRPDPEGDRQEDGEHHERVPRPVHRPVQSQ